MISFASYVSKVSMKKLFPLACCLLAISAEGVRGEAAAEVRQLSNSQARKLIARMAGLELPNGSVRVKTISPGSDGSAEVTAEIKTVFKFEKDKAGRWRVAEVRVGPDRWLRITHIANALNTKIPVDDCSAPDPPFRGSQAVDPSVKRSRCLLASLLGVDLPSDSVRIQEVSPFGVPMASQPSAIVIALITVNARIVHQGREVPRVSELRTGNRDWVQLESLAALVDREKQELARGELAWMAEALEKFRKDRGFYIVSDSQAVAMDHLSPKYLSRVIRVDPWQQPYKYQGQRDRFTLRSVGADGKEGTADDIELAGPSR
jgi:type II secretion system (T2SS) protein G